jgi:hypothetical protein
MADRHVVSPYYGTLYQRIQFHGIVMHRTRQAVIPFDAYCPSLQDKLHLRVCSICKQYIPSATRLRNHYRVHQQRCLPNLVQTIDQKKEEEQSSEESDPVDPYEMPLARIDVTHPTVIRMVEGRLRTRAHSIDENAVDRIVGQCNDSKRETIGCESD